jgi:hypothetical protein
MTVKLVARLKVVYTQCGDAGWWEAWIYKYVSGESSSKLAFNRQPHYESSRDHVLIAATYGTTQHRKWNVLCCAQGIKQKRDKKQRANAYIHTHTYIHIYIYTYTHTYIHTYIYTYNYIHIYIQLYTYIHTHVRTYIQTYIYIHTYVYTYIHTYTYIHKYVHIYKLTNSMEQSRVQKLTTVPQTVKKFLAFCGSRRFNIVFTKVRLLPSSWERINPNHVPPFYLFGIYFHIPFSSRPQSPKYLFLSDFFIKHFVILLPHIRATCHHSHNKGTLKIKKKSCL